MKSGWVNVANSHTCVNKDCAALRWLSFLHRDAVAIPRALGDG